ncbi:hypothetical protein [Romboutsia sp.]|uniref:hypothetical protein n=1 Tax=Romboutsia sp. TaxID=1965302 RepID=UPI003F39767A
MKYINRFIATGIGIALTFSTTCLSNGWFYNICKQENAIELVNNHKEGDFFVKDGEYCLTGNSTQGFKHKLNIIYQLTGEYSTNDVEFKIIFPMEEDYNNLRNAVISKEGSSIVLEGKYLLLPNKQYTFDIVMMDKNYEESSRKTIWIKRNDLLANGNAVVMISNKPFNSKGEYDEK